MRTTNELNKKTVGARLRPCPNNSGITLIALVITIVVMLILVSVTISMAVNGGLFDYAGKAVGDMQNALDAEQKLANGKIKIGDKWYASINDYLNNNPITTGVELTPTEITLKKKESEDVEGEEVLTATITASVVGMESEPEITWEKSSDAITLSATTGKSITVTAAGTTNGVATVTAKCIYEGEEYTAKSEVTLKILKPVITAETMQSNLSSYLGQTVNYGVTYDDASVNNYGGGKWEIFYADGEHIYIITKGHLANGALILTDKNGVAYGGTGDFTAEGGLTNYPAVAQGLFNKTYDPNASGTEAVKYESTTNSNMMAIQYLLDSRNWTTYVDDDYADWAIGGPTLEIFVNSYNASPLSAKDVVMSWPSGCGYASPFTTIGSVPQDSYLNHYTSSNNSPSTYWLACPSNHAGNEVLIVDCSSKNVKPGLRDYGRAFRPVVCLDSNVKLTWDETTLQYDLSY